MSVRWDLGSDIVRRRDFRGGTATEKWGVKQPDGTTIWYGTEKEARKAQIAAEIAPPAAPSPGGFLGIPTMYLLLGGAGIAAFLLFRKKKSS